MKVSAWIKEYAQECFIAFTVSITKKHSKT